MRRGLACALLFLLFAGCDRGEPRRKTAVYPALDESPPPPMPEEEVVLGEVEDADEEPESGYAVEETGGGWVDQAARSQEQIQGLRRQAAQAAPDDPFALSEERIDALSKQHDVILY
ncbi:MAG: hypothetical protein GX615_14365 [Lentisphaerae bacterium]|nr:hypothetical protein [Lentisphaerota bacterium]